MSSVPTGYKGTGEGEGNVPGERSCHYGGGGKAGGERVAGRAGPGGTANSEE